MTSTNSFERALLCTRFALDKKAYDLQLLDVSKLTTVSDYFLICTGRSDTQVRAIAQHVEQSLAVQAIRPRAIEGYTRGQWVLMDYGDVVVHVFLAETRDFYGLDHLWADAPRIPTGCVTSPT